MLQRFLHLICLVNSVTETDNRSQLRALVSLLIRTNVRGFGNRSLLHMAADSATNIRDKLSSIDYSSMYLFPNAKVVELFLSCGHNVNDVDDNGDTALHICAKQFCRSDVEETLLESVSQVLLSHTNISCRLTNLQGRSVVDILTDIATAASLRLSSLATSIVNREEISLSSKLRNNCLVEKVSLLSNTYLLSKVISNSYAINRPNL